MGFGDDIRRIAAEREVEADQIVRGVFLQAVEGVVEKTPVDEGFARGSWVGSVNTARPSPTNNSDRSGQSTINTATAATSNYQAGDTLIISSNLPYMPLLEFGGYGTGPFATDRTTRDGYSIQAPNGMVRITVREILAGLRR